MRTNDVCYQGHFKCAERAGTAAGRYSIPYRTEGGTVGFFCSFFLEGDYLPSGSAFESAARRKPTDTFHYIKHPVNTEHSGTRPVSAGLHAINLIDARIHFSPLNIIFFQLFSLGLNVFSVRQPDLNIIHGAYFYTQ